jgi:hypothetical protein
VVQKTGKYITPDGTVSTEVPEAAKQALSDYLSCQYYLRKTTAK